jgi:hypothetical protein
MLVAPFILGLMRKDKNDACGSRNCKDGARSMRMVPFVSGVYPEVPPSGITFTVRLVLLIATGLPPDWKRAFDGTIDIVVLYRAVCGWYVYSTYIFFQTE